MRYVPSLPPLVEPPPESGAVRAAERVAGVRKVSQRTLPPLVFRPHAETVMPAINRRQHPQLQPAESDRRKLCRRIRNEPILQELRADIDRRHHNQRKDDLTTAIDDKV